MVSRKGFFVLFTVGACLTFSTTSMAQSDQGLESRTYGLGQPANVEDLPPGQLKRKIKALPPKAHVNAMKWLQGFSFPRADVSTLDVDADGNVLYVDTLTVDAGTGQQAESAPAAEGAPSTTLADAFLLHSRPGASNVVFIDFDGHDISGTAWNNTQNPTYNAKSYDLDGNPATFNDAERTNIVDIWHRVAEDMAPFDIDVTTEAPTSFGSHVGHILVTHTVDEQGRQMPANGGGGVAYVNVFGGGSYTYYSPALVYFNHLGGGASTYVAEASSHEFGHNLGLSHDGRYTTGDDETYYAGHGSGLVSWAPIMGNSYYNNVTQWSIGEYVDANQQQDDLDIIDRKLGYAADDHGDTRASASALYVGGDGAVVSSNPEMDPDNLLPENKGVIGHSGDVDVFSFLAGSGAVNLAVTPAWDAFYRSSSRRGANLDVELELQDINGNPVVSVEDPLDDTSASINTSVSAGTYYLLVRGVGNSVTPYSDYDSLGQYFINGAVAPAVADETAPSPSPMQFASMPQATGEDSIAMTAVTAVDDLSAVQYNFRCLSGALQGCGSSGWQAGTSYTASGLESATQYTFVVEARDQSGNVTDPSSPASATTDEPPPPPAYVDFVSVSDSPVAGSASGTHSATHSDNGASHSITERESGGKKNSRFTYLEHRWNFNISQGASATVYANAWQSGDNPEESFSLEYSLDGGTSFADLMTITSTDSANLQAALIPGAPAGNVTLRLVDDHQQPGNRTRSTVHVDHLYIQVANPPTEPPEKAPDGMVAAAVSSSEISLTWVDNSSNESGFLLERSLDQANWVVAADLAANMQSYNDTGRAAETLYHYRVSAYNMNGSAGYATASATTPAAPQPPTVELNLTASGYKDKGKQKVQLEWTGADLVEVYRDGNLVIPSAGDGSVVDHIDLKGGGSYQHYVCDVDSSDTCSSVVETVF